ncbi:MAG: hypothetical protein Q8R91_03145 [Candidatus Omnitrophota bacterium]|nr:hypothetical protein [Candidatus Omnitrophota bacterium]
MRTIQTSASFPLSSVKPLEGLLRYRAYCLEMTRQALRGPTRRRQRSPIGGASLEPFGEIGGLRYLRCQESGSLFLEELPDAVSWARLLQDVSRHRFSSEGFYPGLAQSRTDHVYTPKLEWIRDTLRLQGVRQPIVLEGATPPSTFTHLLKDSGMCSDVLMVDEMTVATGSGNCADAPRVHAAILLESLDRVDDPVALLQGVVNRMEEGGLLFVTALVCSGFDLAVLGLANLYLCPPDRTNCFSLQGLSRLLTQAGLTLIEVSTPGVLDVEVVRAHLQHNPSLPVSRFERQLIEADAQTHEALQAFLQRQGLSSFARLVGKKVSSKQEGAG